MTTDYISGRVDYGAKAKPPKTEDERRVCSEPGCGTILSRYNSMSKCFAHQPIDLKGTLHR